MTHDSISELGEYPRKICYNRSIRGMVSSCSIPLNQLRRCYMLESPEELFPIKGYENRYAITKSGKVWSYPKGNLKPHNGKWLRLQNTHGYSSVNLYKNDNMKTYFIHRLVAETFLPNPENKKEVNHINGVKSDSYLKNLEWVTRRENNLHAKNTCLTKVGHFGEGSNYHKLTEKDVIDIYSNISTGIVLSKKYKVSRALISLIKNKKLWKEILCHPM